MFVVGWFACPACVLACCLPCIIHDSMVKWSYRLFLGFLVMRSAVVCPALVSPSPRVAVPSVSAVVRRAALWGASFACVRPSARSFSGWVCVVSFSSSVVAGRFARFAASRLAVPFCVVRRAGSFWSVSVPCGVSVVPLSPAGSVPCWVVALPGGGGSAPSPSPGPAGFPLVVFLARLLLVRAACAGCLGGRGVVARRFPGVVASAVESVSVVGFSGSRAVAPPAALVSAVAGLVPASAAVSVGCAGGVDAAFRSVFGARASVFRVSAFGAGRGAFAARSVACVRSCVGGVWLSFPAGPCPAGVVPSLSPSACFSGLGSGSWASLAFAVGLGVSSFCWLPPGVSAPSWLVAVGGGWFAPAAAQLSLV